jgi:hypothetical protein
VLCDFRKTFPRCIEIVAGVKQPINFCAVLDPLFRLVDVALIRNERISGFFVGQRRESGI